MNKLINLKIENLYPHPNNPRKDLGELEELAGSIKAKGVMQNLTVVRGHYLTDEERKVLSASNAAAPDPITTEELESGHSDSGYTVISGHRRTAAAKLAGLTELPCVIAEMTEEEQVQTMLLENMQRSDLTIMEQADGFQMMISFGSTIDEVAEKTGFSKATISRRLKLLELDREEFRKSQSRNVTLYDYAALEAIEDVQKRNEVLKFAGTADFKNKLKQAKQDEENNAILDKWEAVIETFADKITFQDYKIHEYVCEYSTWNKKKDEDIVVPDDSNIIHYYYKRTDTRIEICRDKKEKKATPEQIANDLRQKRIENRTEELQTINERHRELRHDFIRNFSAVKKFSSDIMTFVIEASMLEETQNYGYYRSKTWNVSTMCKILNIPEDDKELHDKIRSSAKYGPEYTLLVFAYSIAENGTGYWKRNYYRNGEPEFQYEDNEKLDLLYSWLERFGYEMSEEERRMQNGEYPLNDGIDEELCVSPLKPGEICNHSECCKEHGVTCCIDCDVYVDCDEGCLEEPSEEDAG